MEDVKLLVALLGSLTEASQSPIQFERLQASSIPNESLFKKKKEKKNQMNWGRLSFFKITLLFLLFTFLIYKYLYFILIYSYEFFQVHTCVSYIQVATPLVQVYNVSLGVVLKKTLSGYTKKTNKQP